MVKVLSKHRMYLNALILKSPLNHYTVILLPVTVRLEPPIKTGGFLLLPQQHYICLKSLPLLSFEHYLYRERNALPPSEVGGSSPRVFWWGSADRFSEPL